MARVLFLGKNNDPSCQAAEAFVKSNFSEVESFSGEWGDPLPPSTQDWHGDYIISYLSRWVIPGWLIERASRAAINFHPASPSYPGIGCINFALYDGAAEYGSTCHFIAPKVDTGGIIQTTMFPVFPSDDVASLLSRTYAYQLCLFYDVMGRVVSGETLTTSGESWTRPPFTRKEFNQLSVITPDMDTAEVARRVRATKFGIWRPGVVIGGMRFELA
ncbi:formyltransferase family protein [Sinorhizobium sp. BG8]|uniref:formyltransferase family protein n=1 Tax=Sinorhizobium sp. BG8 TaxID=2613773 RepID=UPI00193CFBF4|nr:formyltransferase family protein [Sinorhizobium sp. BG8]QRM54071.1 hypothetical protein F3Y30_05525 [Sinorhizobium sp. BG8]